jgi:hypothetical protein
MLLVVPAPQVDRHRARERARARGRARAARREEGLVAHDRAAHERARGEERARGAVEQLRAEGQEARGADEEEVERLRPDVVRAGRGHELDAPGRRGLDEVQHVREEDVAGRGADRALRRVRVEDVPVRGRAHLLPVVDGDRARRGVARPPGPADHWPGDERVERRRGRLRPGRACPERELSGVRSGMGVEAQKRERTLRSAERAKAG